MDFAAIIMRGGFAGFALSLGMQLLGFYVAGFYLKVTKENFTAVFIAVVIASFFMVCGFLMYKMRVSDTSEFPLLLAGCVGGWLGAIVFGLTRGKSLLLRFHR
jgi:hypothetical protein